MEFAPLGPEQIGEVGAEMSGLANHVTVADQAAYEVWFYNDQIHVGFEREEAAAHEIEFADVPPPQDGSLHQITVH